MIRLNSFHKIHWALTKNRNLSLSAVRNQKHIKETVQGNVTTIEGVISESPENVLKVENPHGACPLCRLNIFVKYDDVLILRQFLRNDGTVLPREMTGLCRLQQTIMERCVMQAHWSGLLPSSTGLVDRSEYRQFNRYWIDNRDMYSRKLTNLPGSWYYIKRYPNTK